MISRILRGLLLILALLLALAIALRLALKSDTVLEWVRSMAEKQIQQQFRPQAGESQPSATLHIGALHGDLLFGLMGQDIRLLDRDGQLLASIGQIEITYSIPELLTQHRVRSLQLDNWVVNAIHRGEDDGWNWQPLLDSLNRPVEADTMTARGVVDEAESRDDQESPGGPALPDNPQPHNTLHPKDNPQSSIFEWELDHLSVAGGEIYLESATHLPDTTLAIKEISLKATASVQQTGYRAALHSLSLHLHEGRLPESIFLYASASASATSSEMKDHETVTGEAETTETTWTLSKLLLQTGKSIADANASLTTASSAPHQPAGTLQTQLALLPLSHEDLTIFARQDLLNEPIEASLELTGHVRPGSSVFSIPTLDSIGAAITLRSNHLGSAVLRAQTMQGNPLILKSATIEIDRLQGARLTGLAQMPDIRSARWSATGEIPLIDPLNARFLSKLEVQSVAPSKSVAQSKSIELSKSITPSNGVRVDGRNDGALRADLIYAEIAVQDTIVTLRNGRVESPLGNLTLSASQHLLRPTDPENRMELHALLNDSAPLEVFTNQPIRFAGGVLRGIIQPNQTGQWQFEGTVVLDDVAYAGEGMEEGEREGEGPGLREGESTGAGESTGFRASGIRGNLSVTAGAGQSTKPSTTFSLSESIDFAANLIIQEPSVGSYTIRDARFELDGSASTQTLKARTYLDIQNPPFSRLMHQSALRWNNKILTITTDSLLFSSPVRDLHLQKPFDIEVRPGEASARVDTLYLESEDRESFLMAWAPDLRPDRQEAQVYVQNILLGALQMAVLEEPLFEATLSGSASLVRDDATGLSARTDLMIEQASLMEGVIDSILVFAEVENELLDIQTTASMAGRALWDVVCELPVPGIGSMPDRTSTLPRERASSGAPSYPTSDSAPVQPSDQPSDCRIDLFPTPMRALTPFLPNSPIIPENTAGLLSVSAHLTGSIDAPPSMDGHILLHEATLSGVPVDSLTTDLLYNHQTEELTLTGSLIVRQTPALAFEASLPLRVDLEQSTVSIPSDAKEIRLSAGTNQFDLAVLNDLLLGDSPGGGTSGGSTSGGSTSGGSARDGNTSSESGSGRSTISGSTSSESGSGRSTISGSARSGIAGLSGLGGYIDGQILVRVDGNAFSPDNDSGEGFSLQNADMDGVFTLRDGRLDVDPYGVRLRDVKSVVRFEPGLITLDSFSVKSGPGTLDASGSIDLRTQSDAGELARSAGLDVTLKGRRFALADSRSVTAITNMDATLTGTMEAPVFSGSAQILSGFLLLSGFGETKVEEVDLRQVVPDGGKTVTITPNQKALETPSENETDRFWDRLAMDFGIRTDRRFFIRNRDMIELELELGGELDLVKEPGAGSEPALFGTISGLGGYTKTLGKEFRFEEADVTFSGDPFNPSFRMRTSYEPPRSESEIQLFYIIEGTLENPEFRFESIPEMELQDIISYTVFGKPFYELQSWEQVVAGSGEGTSAAELAVEVLLDRVELLASEQLGIDVVRIDNQQRGSDRATSILTGWYLDRRTFFAMINELSSDPKTLFVIEYLLREDLELILTQGDDSRQGVDIRWEYDY